MHQSDKENKIAILKGVDPFLPLRAFRAAKLQDLRSLHFFSGATGAAGAEGATVADGAAVGSAESAADTTGAALSATVAEGAASVFSEELLQLIVMAALHTKNNTFFILFLLCPQKVGAVNYNKTLEALQLNVVLL